MPLSIRSAVPGDLAAILVIEQEAASAAHWARDQYAQRVADGTILVAEEERSISGFLCARAVAREWEIENVVVAEAARRRGIANRLLEEFQQRALSQGATAVWLEVRESNQAALRLYGKHGLQEAALGRSHYEN